MHHCGVQRPVFVPKRWCGWGVETSDVLTPHALVDGRLNAASTLQRFTVLCKLIGTTVNYDVI